MNNSRTRYRQRDFHLNEIDNIENIEWSLEKYGCGPTSIANILSNFGFVTDPIYITKKILFDENGKFDKTYIRKNGINKDGLIYCLNRLIEEDKLDIEYKIIHIDFNNPYNQKKKIIEMLNDGYMAVIHVGPSEISPLSFSKYGHYLVISDIDEKNNFYVINSNEIGDKQLGIPFSYETIIKNMYGRKDSFNFIFIKKIMK